MIVRAQDVGRGLPFMHDDSIGIPGNVWPSFLLCLLLGVRDTNLVQTNKPLAELGSLVVQIMARASGLS